MTVVCYRKRVKGRQAADVWGTFPGVRRSITMQDHLQRSSHVQRSVARRKRMHYSWQPTRWQPCTSSSVQMMYIDYYS